MQHIVRNRSRLTVLAVLFLALGAGIVSANQQEVDWAKGEFVGGLDEVQTFMKFYDDIELTPEQEAIRVAALDPMPAPCCHAFSAATCCCKCNLSRSLWGLSKHLITERGADAETVRAAAESWVAKIGPEEWPGNTCQSGRCGQTFEEGGCGGMNPQHLVYPK